MDDQLIASVTWGERRWVAEAWEGDFHVSPPNLTISELCECGHLLKSTIFKYEEFKWEAYSYHIN